MGKQAVSNKSNMAAGNRMLTPVRREVIGAVIKKKASRQAAQRGA
jgi:hypothetical protein